MSVFKDKTLLILLRPLADKKKLLKLLKPLKLSCSNGQSELTVNKLNFNNPDSGF
jgi:hypothetical protein